MENYEMNKAEVESTKFDRFIKDQHYQNDRLMEIRDKLDRVCNTIDGNNYPKNITKPQPGIKEDKVAHPSGIVAEFDSVLSRKSNLINDIQDSINFIEQHI